VLSKLKDKTVTVIGIIAPAVRTAIGEEFGLPAGTLATRKMYGAMRKAGFEILDNNFAADLTIMEEGTEFIQRARHHLFGESAPEHIGPLSQFTSCYPAWVRFMELHYPKQLAHLSTAKSPQQMAGVVAKTYGALKVWNRNPRDIFAVGIMPCTAKKFEASVTLKDDKYGKDIALRIAVVNGLRGNIKPLMDDLVQGRSPYHFVEVMNCPGGCVNGGGQPIRQGGSSWLEAALPWFAWKQKGAIMNRPTYDYTENPGNLSRREFLTIGGIVIALLALPKEKKRWPIHSGFRSIPRATGSFTICWC